MNLYKTCEGKSYSLLINDTNLASDNLLCFTRNILERMQKVIMTINEKIRSEKLQYDLNTEAAKLSSVSSRKIDKYEYLPGKKILPSSPSQMIEQTNFANSPVAKAFEKQIKIIEDQREK